MAGRTYRIGEIFCGAGGLAQGAKQATLQLENGEVFRCQHTWAIDSNPWACATYERNFQVKPHCCKVQEVNFGSLPKIDGLMFGFPCNDYSLVGEHKGLQGEYGPLYSYGIKAIEAHEPDWFLAENVSGLTSANQGEAFRRIMDDLAQAGKGYNLVAHLYRFEHYGVPQMRHRVVLVGIRQDLNREFRVPRPTTDPGLDPGTKLPCVQEAISNIPDDAPNHEKISHPPRVVEMLAAIPEGANAWDPSVPEHLRLNVANCRLSHIYRRLHRDLPAPTVTARGGGGTHGYHWEEPRALTNRERALIQTFPPDFVFEGPKGEVRAQIGMAVPPLGAQVIIEAILKTLAGVEYPTADARWTLNPIGPALSAD